jgi:predicted transcriptional regulator of viral defense system
MPEKGTTDYNHLFAIASTQAGYFTAKQAHLAGYTKNNITYHVKAGHFERIKRGFYRLRVFPASSHEDVIAAWLKAGAERAFVSHETALGLYELYPGRAHRIDITVHREHLPRFKYREVLPGVRLHTVRRPLRPDEVGRQFGVRVTSPARTIADAAEAGVDPGYIVDAVAQALRRGAVTERELESAATDRARRVRDLIKRALEEAKT